MAEDTLKASPAWLEYERGRPEQVDVTVGRLLNEVARLRTCCREGGDGETRDNPQDSAETPDTGPWLDVPNYKAKIRAIRTDKNGKYQGTTLEAIDAIPKPNIPVGGLFILHNKNWEDEFKRAQNGNKKVCLRIGGDGKVEAIEVLD